MPPVPPTPIFWVDGNNNNIDKISGQVAVPTGTESNSYYNYPWYVADPVVAGNLCLRKRNSQVNIGVFPMFRDKETWKNYQLSSITPAGSSIPLDNWNGQGHRLEFEVYVNNNNTNRPFLVNGALFSATYRTNAGCEIGIWSNNLVVFSRNNSSTDIIHQIAPYQNIINQWLKIQYDVKEISSTTFSVVVKVYLQNGNLLTKYQQILTKPMTTNKDDMLLFSNNMGWFTDAQNIYDYLKEVKIFRQNDLYDFSIYT